MQGTGTIAQQITSGTGPSEHHLRQRDLEAAELLSKLLRKTHQGFKMEPLEVPEGTSVLDALKTIFATSDTGILTDEGIAELCSGEKPMLSPFIPEQVRKDQFDRKIMSYGLSSMGYDVRLKPMFKIFTNLHNAVIDPLNMPENSYVDVEPTTDETGTYVILPANSYLLSVTEEWFEMPDNVVSICVGKSTGARAGLMVNVTPIEPGFKGNVVIELANLTPSPMKVYANMGIAQFLFFRSNKRCKTTYGDRGGKYQGQSGIQTAIV